MNMHIIQAHEKRIKHLENRIDKLDADVKSAIKTVVRITDLLTLMLEEAKNAKPNDLVPS